MKYHPIVFREIDFTPKGKEMIYDTCNRLIGDINNSEDSTEDKNEARDRLYNFLREYKFQSIKRELVEEN